jgi:RimJ/RimL family protein N-acetyltransferase
VNQRLDNRQAPERLATERLTLRRPQPIDAPATLQSYAGDPEVTRLLAWPRHRSVDDTLSFLAWSRPTSDQREQVVKGTPWTW